MIPCMGKECDSISTGRHLKKNTTKNIIVHIRVVSSKTWSKPVLHPSALVLSLVS